MSQHFKIITTCYDVEKWISCSLQSLLRQNYKNWQGIVIDDRSPDNTCSIISDLIKDSDKITFVQNKQQVLKIPNLINAINTASPDDEDVLVFLDGDDWLPDAGVLDYLASVYENDVWITWGSFIKWFGKEPIVFDDYSEFQVLSKLTKPPPSNWNIRKDWRYSHLKTCKYFLWKNIKDESLRTEVSGEYFPTLDDIAFMYPMVEMAGPEHSKCIDRVMYVYNYDNAESFKRIILEKDKSHFTDMQKAYRNEIVKKPRYSIKTKEELLQNHC